MARDVVVLQGPGSIPELTVLLRSEQWVAHHVAHASQVLGLKGSCGCQVGIVVFDAALDCSPGEFIQYAETSGMEWIAVVGSDFSEDRITRQALASSFCDYLRPPIDGARLLNAVEEAHRRALRRSNVQGLATGNSRFGMIGASPRMIGFFRELEKVTAVRVPLLITGESGVGKELAARAVHFGSDRARGPFVAVNCGALPLALIESLLFGHEKGAFTGAHERHIGSIEAAHTGTIFLDEIGDLPHAAQASLLRFLQESTIVRVGSTRELRIDTRVIAATHMNLRDAVRAKRFRADLLYRLNVLSLEVPPLRARGDDCILLAEHFIQQQSDGKDRALRRLSKGAIAAIRAYHWPGNVRELQNRLQRAMVMCEGSLILAEDLQLDAEGARDSPVGTLSSARNGMDRALVQATLQRENFNVAATARQLGVSRVTLYRLLKRLQIDIAATSRHDL